MKRYWIIVSLISLSLFTTNCTKEDWTPDGAELSAEILPATATIDDTLSQFLTYDYLSSVNEALVPIPTLRSSDPMVDSVMQSLEDLDAQHGFIKNVVRKYGFPVWDRTRKVYDSRRETTLFIPLAFPESTEVTAYFSAVPWKGSYWFRLVKKDQITQAIKGKGKFKDWENLPFTVMEFYILDLDLFEYTRVDYFEWLVNHLNSKGNESEAVTSLRSCSVVEITECTTGLTYQTDDGRRVGMECTTSYEYFCDSGSTDGSGSRCQECTGSTDGGSSSGGSSGSSGTTTEPTYDHPTDSDPSSAYTNLNESQYYHLRQEGFTEEQVAAFSIVYGNLLAETGDFQWPITEEELNDFVTILMYEMLNLETLIDLVVPGFADIKSAIEKFKNSSYWGGTFDLAMALVDLFPASKITKASLVVAVKVRRSSKILDIFKIVKRLGNQKMYKGFKKTIVNEYKNPHIFQVKQGHLGDPNFEDLIKWAGGQQELIAKVYEKVYKEGLHNGIPSNIPREFVIYLDGKKVRGSIIDLPSLDQIRIDDFWYQN